MGDLGLDHHRLREAGWQTGWLRPPSQHQPPSEGLVLKLGGSLLARADWPVRLTGLLAALDRPVQLVVGGGEVVEGLRRLDAACPQPAERMHRLAITAMDVTARLVAETLELPLLPSSGTVDSASGVVLVRSWLDEGGLLRDLPQSWSVTSDSIAAAIAAASSRPLLLLKSVSPPTTDASPGVIEAAAAAGWVDAAFPRAAATLRGVAWAAPLEPRPRETGA